ncbi:uncharacterized protein [Lolium perenne]|uniref:uncharacterized protein n=1 Tax=Lolium perenne TaxID=4522 RepID=UPI003A99BC11
MAFGQEASEQLWQELLGGYNLNARLLALLGDPLDKHGQEAALAMSQELSRVFMVSLYTLKPGDSSRVARVRTMAPETTVTEGSVSQRTPATDERICSGEEAVPHRKRIGEEVIEKKITASPHKEGYRWKKYGQKNIQKRKFPRQYYKCMYSHERGCRAKKRVQQQDNGSDAHGPMFQVTFMNEHTCHQVLPSQNSSNNATNLPATNTTSTMTRNGAHSDPAAHIGDNAGLQNKIMTCALTTVIGGAPSPPPPVEVSQLSDSASYVPPRLPEVSMGLEYETTVSETGFSCGSPIPPPVEAPAAPSSWSLPPPLHMEASSSYLVGGGNIPSMDPMMMEEMYFPCAPLFSPVAAHSSIIGCDDVPMAVVAGQWYTDTSSPWPQY